MEERACCNEEWTRTEGESICSRAMMDPTVILWLCFKGRMEEL
jgi:hypothetical protein